MMEGCLLTSVSLPDKCRCLPDKVLPPVLQKAEVSILSQTECKKSYGPVSPRMLCAGVSSGERDACRVSSAMFSGCDPTEAWWQRISCSVCVSGGFGGAPVLPGSRRGSLVPHRHRQLGFRLRQTKPAWGLHQG